ncbi:MAG: YjjG family noncanonical pyrimidine nucleotidase [Clostridia bacterium]|nr:YjjG family noncanonical pyrimidine nucleotidase [Clostridia bacterium]
MIRYQTVLFDADETLLNFQKSERAALVEALNAFGVDPDEEMISTYSKINSATWKKLERGEITKLQLRTARFADFCTHYGFDWNVERLADTYLQALSRQSYLLPGALELCQTLSHHCRLYIITNGIAFVQHGRLDESPIRRFFKELFISDEIGAEKPSTAFFDRVIGAIPDFDAATTLVVGDSLSSDMAGGIGAGLDTCWYNPAEKPVPKGMAITHVVKTLEEILPLVLGA